MPACDDCPGTGRERAVPRLLPHAEASAAGRQRFCRDRAIGQGMLEVFKRFERRVLTGARIHPFAQSHPVSGDRALRHAHLVDASPYGQEGFGGAQAPTTWCARRWGYLRQPDSRSAVSASDSSTARYGRAWRICTSPTWRGARRSEQPAGRRPQCLLIAILILDVDWEASRVSRPKAVHFGSARATSGLCRYHGGP